jgi:(p)ppGpp synthase/HD superfamily hydrolase
LRNGQSVSIIRADAQLPQASWEGLVITGRAKTAIRRNIKEQYKSSHIKLGSELARVAFERIGKKATERALQTAAKKMGKVSSDDILAALGAAEITSRELIINLYPNLVKADTVPFSTDETINFVGLPKGQNAVAAKCCQPVPGERIVGVVLKGKGIDIHAIDCNSLENFDQKSISWIDLSWPRGEVKMAYPSTLMLTMVNGAGVLGRICTLVGDMGANIIDMVFLERKHDFYSIRIELHVSDVQHLLNIITSIEADTDIAEVVRFRETQKAFGNLKTGQEKIEMLNRLQQS